MGLIFYKCNGFLLCLNYVRNFGLDMWILLLLIVKLFLCRLLCVWVRRGVGGFEEINMVIYGFIYFSILNISIFGWFFEGFDV